MAPSRASKEATAQEFEMFVHSGSGRAIKIGSSTVTIAVVCLLALTFFSVADYRELAYQRREKDLSQSQVQNKQELAAFAQWLGEKERDLDRYLMMTGEQAERAQDSTEAPKNLPASYGDVRQSIERLENRIRILSDFQMRDEEYFWNVPSISPVALQEDFTLATGPLSKQAARTLSGVSSFQGIRFHPLKRKEEMHYGIDIFCPIGSSVRATANGTVSFVGHYTANQDNLRSSFGNFMVIRHGDTGIETTYAHLNNILVARGQLVKRGDPIGTTGNSGSSTGPHLHYEIARNGVRVNPLNYITDVPLIEGGKKVFYVKNDKRLGGKKERGKS